MKQGKLHERHFRYFRHQFRRANTTEELDTILHDVLHFYETFPEELLSPLENKVSQYVSLIPATAIHIIEYTHSDKLYEHIKEELSLEQQLKLMAIGYYHQDLELKVCKPIYSCIEDKPYSEETRALLTLQNIEAIAKSGQSLSLDLLHNIDFTISLLNLDLEDSKTIRERFPKIILNAEMRYFFGVSEFF